MFDYQSVSVSVTGYGDMSMNHYELMNRQSWGYIVHHMLGDIYHRSWARFVWSKGLEEQSFPYENCWRKWCSIFSKIYTLAGAMCHTIRTMQNLGLILMTLWTLSTGRQSEEHKEAPCQSQACKHLRRRHTPPFHPEIARIQENIWMCLQKMWGILEVVQTNQTHPSPQTPQN